MVDGLCAARYPVPMPTSTAAAAACPDVRAARLAVAEYVARVQARRRAEHPDDVVARWAWTREESAELDRLIALAAEHVEH